VLGALSLLFGNLGAMPQTNIKRLMGYSSIAQCGYLLVGLAAGWTAGIDGALFYVAAYVAMNLCAFLVILVVSRATGSHEIDDYAGLSRRSPILGMGLTVSLLSLSGVPPFWGFVGKFMLIGSSFADPTLHWLGVTSLAMVVVALFYYLRVVKRIWVFEERVKTPIATPLRLQVFIVVATVVMLGLAIFPAVLETTTGDIAKGLGFPGFEQIRR
jgi:NADH-quinone oxidoreductase subunit N